MKCSYCSNEFTEEEMWVVEQPKFVWLHTVKSRQKDFFCSFMCKRSWELQRQIEMEEIVSLPDSRIRLCWVCGLPFRIARREASRRTYVRRWCSPKCQTQLITLNHREYKRAHKSNKGKGYVRYYNEGINLDDAISVIRDKGGEFPLKDMLLFVGGKKVVDMLQKIDVIDIKEGVVHLKHNPKLAAFDGFYKIKEKEVLDGS